VRRAVSAAATWRISRTSAAIAVCLTSPLGAQRLAGPQPELRIDAIASRAPTLQLGVGANVPAGLYVRIGLTGAVGAARSGGEARSAARVDLTTRFLLDPLREARVGLYALGGMSAMYDGYERWRPRLVVGLGVEGRPSHRSVAAFELALGGGVRAGLVLRRPRSGRR
jgi:hypothetical protein